MAHTSWINRLRNRIPVPGPDTAAAPEPLLSFTERLDALQALADSTSDQVRASAYRQAHQALRAKAARIEADIEVREVTPADLREVFAGWKQLGRLHLAEYPEAAELFKAGFPVADPTIARPADRWGSAEEWFDNEAPDLGHRDAFRRYSQLADRAVATGDLDAAAGYRNTALAIGDEAQHDESAAARAAYSADNYREVLDDARRAAARQMDAIAQSHDVDISAAPDGTRSASLIGPELPPAQVVESAVRHAYDMWMQYAREDGPVDRSWFPVATIRDELDRHARAVGREPYSAAEVDAAIERLTTRTGRGRAQVSNNDPTVLTQDDLERLEWSGGIAQDLLKIDESTLDYPTDLDELAVLAHMQELPPHLVETAATRLSDMPADRYVAALNRLRAEGLTPTTEPADPDFVEAARLQRERVLEHTIRDLYTRSRLEAEETDGADQPWISVADIHAAVAEQAHRDGRKPYGGAEIDDALHRLAHDPDGDRVRMRNGDAPLTDDDHASSAAFGYEGDWELMIDDPPAATPNQDTAEAEQAQSLPSAAETAEAAQEHNANGARRDPVTADDLAPHRQRDHQSADNRSYDAQADETHSTEEVLDTDTGRSADTAQDAAGENYSTEPADGRERNHSREADDEAAAAGTENPAVETEPSEQRGRKTLACSAAVTRAQVSLDKVHRHIEARDTATRVEAERDEELARWHADDQAARQTDNTTQAVEPAAPTIEAPVLDRGHLDR